MKILKEGQLPGDVVLQCTCTNCKTQFEFEAREALERHEARGQLDQSYYSVMCPFANCGQVNYVTI